MTPLSPQLPENISQEAASWVIKQDRGLNADERRELTTWLTRDPLHLAALQHHRRQWERINGLAQLAPEKLNARAARPDPDLLAPRRSPPASARTRSAAFFRYLAPTLGLAAIAVLGIFLIHRAAYAPSAQTAEIAPAQAPATAPTFARIESLALEDGSIVQLNHGARVSTHFTASERRLTLETGEAHFTVAKNPHRPFIVTASGLEIRAVGTAFNIKLDSHQVDILVTEGKVGVQATEPETALAPLHLEIGQQASVSLAPETTTVETPRVSSLAPAEISRQLAWQPRLLDFTAAPLREIIATFNQHNRTQLGLADATLGELRLSATFRSDNLEGFVRLLEASYSIKAQLNAGQVNLAPAR